LIWTGRSPARTRVWDGHLSTTLSSSVGLLVTPISMKSAVALIDWTRAPGGRYPKYTGVASWEDVPKSTLSAKLWTRRSASPRSSGASSARAQVASAQRPVR
jgi:hypothetical protein